MAKIGLRLRHLVSLGLLVGCITSAGAAPAAPSEADVSMAMELHAELARSFFLSKELQIDPALRVAANNISSAHLSRMKQLLPLWLQEERRLQSTEPEIAGKGAVSFAVWARVLNELALWQIESGDAEYEKATLDVLKKSPLVCRTAGDFRYSDFSTRMLRVQAMPTAQRQAALDTERLLLERWGKPRPALQPWPNPLPQDAGMLAIAQIQSGGPRPPLALAPHLASSLLAEREGYEDQPWESRCAFQRWWLQVSLAQGAAPAAALTAFRYGTLLTATDRLGTRFETDENGETETESAARPAYPKLAAHFDVTGVTTVTRRPGAPGKPAQASVTGRKIAVRGIRDTRPVAFENTFDAVAVQYALKNGGSAKRGKTEPEVFDMVWNLEPHDANPDKTSQGETP